MKKIKKSWKRFCFIFYFIIIDTRINYIINKNIKNIIKMLNLKKSNFKEKKYSS